MEFATFLLKLLAGGAAPGSAGLSAPGRDALEALTARLEEEHDVETLSLLPRAIEDAGARQAILSELLDPDIAEDAGACAQAEILRAELESLSEPELARRGLSASTLRAGREILAQVIEGSVGRRWTRGADAAGEGV